MHATGTDVAATLKHLHRMLRGFSMFWPPKEFDKRVEVFERDDRAVDNTFHRRMEHAIYGDEPLAGPEREIFIERTAALLQSLVNT